MKKNFPTLLAFLLAVFGLLTLFLSTSIIFDLFNIRTREGHYVPFVVVANFISSLLYLLAAYGFFQKKKMDPQSVSHISRHTLCYFFCTTGIFLYRGIIRNKNNWCDDFQDLTHPWFHRGILFIDK